MKSKSNHLLCTPSFCFGDSKSVWYRCLHSISTLCGAESEGGAFVHQQGFPPVAHWTAGIAEKVCEAQNICRHFYKPSYGEDRIWCCKQHTQLVGSLWVAFSVPLDHCLKTSAMKVIYSITLLAAGLSLSQAVCTSSQDCAQVAHAAIRSLQPSRPLAAGQISAVGIAQRMIQPALNAATKGYFDGGGSDIDTEWCPNKSYVAKALQFALASRCGKIPSSMGNYFA